MSALYTADLSDIFFPMFRTLAKQLGCENPFELAAPMGYESGIRADKFNALGSQAVGLIQFMPSTLQGMGWTAGPVAFSKLTPEAQLAWVQRYLGNYKPLGKAANVYCAIFMPADVRKADDPEHVLTAKGGFRGWAFEGNKSLDADGNGAIQVKELQLAAGRGAVAMGNRWKEFCARLGEPVPQWLLDAEAHNSVRTALRTPKGLQLALLKLGYDVGATGADGIMGGATVHAVRLFQGAQHLVADGVPGPRTFTAIERALRAA